MRSVIITSVDHHPATKALSRVEQLLDYSKDGYAIADLTYRTTTPEELRAAVGRVLTNHVGSATQFCVGCDWQPTAEEIHSQNIEGVLIRAHQANMVTQELLP